MGMPQGEERREQKKHWKQQLRISPKLRSDTKPHMQEAQKTINTKKNYIEAYHIQTAKDQRQRRNLE